MKSCVFILIGVRGSIAMQPALFSVFAKAGDWLLRGEILDNDRELEEALSYGRNIILYTTPLRWRDQVKKLKIWKRLQEESAFLQVLRVEE